MLQDDRHRLGILHAHALGQPHAGRRGGEGDLEMMFAGQPFLGRIGQNGAHHAAQRFLRQDVVTNVIDGHVRNQWSVISNQIADKQRFIEVQDRCPLITDD